MVVVVGEIRGEEGEKMPERELRPRSLNCKKIILSVLFLLFTCPNITIATAVAAFHS